METVKALLSAGADVHRKNDAGYARSPLSAFGKRVSFQSMVPNLLRRETALHLSSSNGHTTTVRALMVAGADVDCKRHKGYDHECVRPVSMLLTPKCA
jgi:ankyrin repeat protein